MFKGKLTDRATQVRFFRFLVVGGLAAAVQFGALWLLNDQFDPNLAFSISYCCSTGTHYLLNRFWALPSRRRDTGRQFGEYVVTVVLSYLVNLGTFKFGHDLCGLTVMWAAFWAIPPSTILVFALLHYRVFRIVNSDFKD